MAETQDYVEDVKRYAADAELDRVKIIIYYCGIEQGSRDLTLVMSSNGTEKNSVREGFCAKKLGMDSTEANAAIDAVCQIMKADRNKKRVTFYYLLAEYSGKLEKL